MMEGRSSGVENTKVLARSYRRVSLLSYCTMHGCEDRWPVGTRTVQISLSITVMGNGTGGRRISKQLK